MWQLVDGKLVRRLGPYTLTIRQTPDGKYIGEATDGNNVETTLFPYETLRYAKAATLRAARSLAWIAYSTISKLSLEYEEGLRVDLER